MSLKRNGSGYFDFTAFKAIVNLEGSNKMNVYKGDIFYIKKGGRGSDQNSERPAVIVSNDVGNEHSGIVEVVYLTSQPKKDLPTHAKVLCSVPSVALCEQINTVSKERLGSYIRTCTEKEMNDIDAKLKVSLGLNGEDETQNNSEEVEQLKNQLKEAGAKIKELKSKLLKETKLHIDEVAEYKLELERRSIELKDKQKALDEKISIEAQANENELNTYIIQLETERDLYKEQYEALLERLISK